MKYKGIELEGLDKDVKLAHSRFTEADEGTDWIDKLLTCDKAALMPTQFHEVSALSSVINMDYQICNGGIGQYVGNGYHEYRAPYSDDDVEHYGAVEQVYMLRALADFGDNVFPYADSCNREVRQWANLFDRIDFDSVDYYDEVIGEGEVRMFMVTPTPFPVWVRGEDWVDAAHVLRGDIEELAIAGFSAAVKEGSVHFNAVPVSDDEDAPGIVMLEKVVRE